MLLIFCSGVSWGWLDEDVSPLCYFLLSGLKSHTANEEGWVDTGAVTRHPKALGIKRSPGSRFVTDVGGGRLSTTRVLLDDGEAEVAELQRETANRPDVFCPFCGERGKYRHFTQREGISHFAHASGDECVGTALESVLHLRAKRLLRDGLLWLRGEGRPVLVTLPCLRCRGVAVVPVLHPGEWHAESVEVPLDAFKFDVAALRDDAVTCGLEVRVSHAVDAIKATHLGAAGIPCAEFLASALIDETSGDILWQPHRPLPLPMVSWNLERVGVPFAVCPSCRRLPQPAQALAQVAAHVADGAVLRRLRAGLPDATELGPAGEGIQAVLGAWQSPEEVSSSLGVRLARVGASSLVSGEVREFVELLERPFERVLAALKDECAVPRKAFAEAEAAWLALGPEARAKHRDARRRSYALQFVAKQAADRGSTAVSVESLVDVVRRCAPDEAEQFAAALGRLVITSSPLAGGNGFVGFSSLVVAEQSVLARVATRVNRGPLRPSTFDGTVDERERAVDLAFTSRFAIITGGPGTGKTTAVRHLMKCIEAERSMQSEHARPPPWLLCAPTNKALSRLKQGLTDFDFIEFRTAQAAVLVTYDVPPAGVLVDEASFLDSSLASQLLSKFAASDQLILVGDPNQLPSVSPGAVLRDLMERFPTSVFRMTTNHRTEGRALAEAAVAMNGGRLPRAVPGEVEVELVETSSLLTEALSFYQSLARGRSPADVQVLAGLRKTVASLNAKLQTLQNPTGRSLTPWLRAGDRVVVTEILERTLAPGLHRGLMGTIHAGLDGKLLLQTEDGRSLTVDLAAASVEPSYAMTVHRSQGSEWPCVLLVLDDTNFLSRNLVYTAFTRARSRVVILSAKGVLGRSLRNVVQRHSAMSTRLLP